MDCSHSDFTVTTGIVSSLSGLLNDTRFLQISAAVQPGNSGGPLLASSGDVVGVVAAKLNALKVVRATGTIPENINFAIKTGALRDFLDNSVVPYQISDATAELKTTDIARSARAFTPSDFLQGKAEDRDGKKLALGCRSECFPLAISPISRVSDRDGNKT